MGGRGKVTRPLCADVSPRWGMRGERVGSSYSLSPRPDAVVSVSQCPQWAGAPGSSGAAAVWLQGVVAVQA